jgi:LCP family protein required for cell wall assembly
MSRDPDNRTPTEDPPYRVYRSGEEPRQSGPPQRDHRPADAGERPYRIYRSAPRGLLARLRGEDDTVHAIAEMQREPPRGRAGEGPGGRRWLGPLRGPLSWRKGVAILATVIAGWILLSLALFFISAEQHAGDIPASAQAQLTSGGPMLTSANTVLILGLDSRPTTGFGSKEPGANHSERFANTDTIMLWRIGGGVSRRLSIPRDTLVDIPGLGESKINAAWSRSPGLALRVIKRFTGVKINHLIVVDLANFPSFIDDVGGVTVKTGRVCSQLAGGTAKGGFTLDLRPGYHHLNGIQTEVLARTRDNLCNSATNDLTREGVQQQILNAIKSQLLTLHTFLHLPWVAWDAPEVVQTDMGPLTLLQMFLAAEIGGSASPSLLKETPETLSDGADVLVPNAANVHAQVRRLMTGR